MVSSGSYLVVNEKHVNTHELTAFLNISCFLESELTDLGGVRTESSFQIGQESKGISHCWIWCFTRDTLWNFFLIYEASSQATKTFINADSGRYHGGWNGRCNSKDWEKWWIDVNALIKWHKWRRYIDISRNRWVVKNYGVWLSTFNKEKKRLSIMQKWNKSLVSTGLAQIKTKAQKLNENHLLWSKRAVVMWRDEAIWLAWISSPTWTC